MERATTSALDHLAELIRGIDVAMLTTVDRTGNLHSRPMMALRKTTDGALWFFTEASSHMVDDVAGHHPVSIGYVDAEHGRYVSVSGRARVVGDRAKKAELWESRLAQWLPNGFEDSSVALLRIEVQEAEFWDSGGAREISAAVEFNVREAAVRNEKISFR
ncbi:MAG TPA: pyridoxamine 5'-phosphate oxidase family protein [Methylomirabilota bacterium]|nr:pyridoxamine 5'-phosphate oxidase family protein [Methylomirabilota bacterium]